tara:strand:+ start:114 stop:425 length:312 start_codon:yes stop_codon:yes gene_type:complete
MKRRLTKPTLDNLRQAFQLGKFIKSSDWTTGKGRWTSRKAVPPYYELVYIYDWDKKLNKEAEANLERARKKHPRATKFLVCTNARAVKKTLKEAEEFYGKNNS